jgi:hypothetical protein
MLTTAGLVSWAREQATQLEAEMTFRRTEYGYGWSWWEATSPAARSRIQARAYAALDFLDRFAGVDSQWAVSGRTAFEKNEHEHSMETGAPELGEVLRAWADQVEAGIVPIRQVDAQGARAVASSDLMEQVRGLREAKGIHPAAPIVLAGGRWKSACGPQPRSWTCPGHRNRRLAPMRGASVRQGCCLFRT